MKKNISMVMHFLLPKIKFSIQEYNYFEWQMLECELLIKNATVLVPF